MELDPGIQFVLSQLNQPSAPPSGGEVVRPSLDEFRVMFNNVSRLASGNVESIESIEDLEVQLV